MKTRLAAFDQDFRVGRDNNGYLRKRFMQILILLNLLQLLILQVLSLFVECDFVDSLGRLHLWLFLEYLFGPRAHLVIHLIVPVLVLLWLPVSLLFLLYMAAHFVVLHLLILYLVLQLFVLMVHLMQIEGRPHCLFVFRCSHLPSTLTKAPWQCTVQGY